MDPSYNNSLGNTGSGGISSGGVGAAGGVSGGVPVGVSVGGNVPAGGSSPMMSAPISSGTGDIVLAPEKKSRKGLIVAVVVGLLVVVGLVAGIFLTRSGGVGGANMSAKEAFNRYANYLLYGEESDADLENKNLSEKETIYSMMTTEEFEQVETYANNLGALWDTFRANAENPIGDGMTLEDYDKRIRFAMTYLLNRQDVDEDRLTDMVMNSNVGEDPDAGIDDYFGLYSEFDFDEARDYVDNGKMYYDDVIKILTTAKDLGCNLNGDENIGNTCNEAALIGESQEGYASDIYYSNMQSAVYGVVEYLIENCWQINSEMNGGRSE